MDRDEAVLRELNLYPLWVRRDAVVPDEEQEVAPVAETVTGPVVLPEPVVASVSVSSPDKTTGRVIQPVSEEVSSPLPLGEGLGVRVLDGSISQNVGNLDWSELKQQVRDCTACKLRSGCMQTVFGVGDENADWLFVGEAPGADEDVQGEPFVGKAGKLLDNMLRAIKLERGSNVYITSIVKCCPPNNRNPDAAEIATCLPYLKRQIELIQPKIIVALGKTAATALLGRDATLKSLRGQLHDYHGTPLLITYHPAYLLRSPSEKAKAWQDLCLAVDACGTKTE